MANNNRWLCAPFPPPHGLGGGDSRHFRLPLTVAFDLASHRDVGASSRASFRTFPAEETRDRAQRTPVW